MWYLNTCMNTERPEWDEFLSEAVYSYNTTVQGESTKHTLFEAVFGWRGNLPIDFNVATNYNPDECLKGFPQVKVYFNILYKHFYTCAG